MNKLNGFYRLLNILSIDVVLGAVCCAAWFANYFEVQLRPYALICLGLTVWIIYSADHLMDAIKVKGEASTLRHRFHQEHFKGLIMLLLVASIIDFVLLFFLRAQVLHAGILLICIVVMYLLLSRRLTYLKEIAVAGLYCGGVLLPALSLKESGMVIADQFVILCFFLTALINVIMFAWFDHALDIRDGNKSFSTKFGKGFTKKLLIILFGLQVVFLVMLIVAKSFPPLIIFGCMNGILYLLFIRSDQFNRAEYYRLLGDAVFLIPSLFLLI
jgi:4-hydroxybenzoate polyprenyltransferase